MELADLIKGQDDLRNEVAQLINKYQFLPACMIEPVLKFYYEQITDIQQNQLQEAKEVIENRQSKNKEKKGDK